LQETKDIQAIAKSVLTELASCIDKNSTELSIAKAAENLLKKNGIHESWYYRVPALVLVGSRTSLYLSGKDYKPGTDKAGNRNLITVSLSPSKNKALGSYAKSFVIEDGKCTAKPKSEVFIEGFKAMTTLHNEMRNFANPDTTFKELHSFGNKLLSNLGFTNLHILETLGYNLELGPSIRNFIDQNCDERLGVAKVLAFETHIKNKSNKWGFKFENLYRFDKNGILCEL